MKTKSVVLLFCIGIFSIVYSMSSLELFATEPGSGQCEVTENCTCADGIHLGELGKKKTCSATASGTACTRDQVWNKEHTWYEYTNTYSPTNCKYCSYPDCSGKFCSLMSEPE
jgi:hypothetical protein